MNGSPKIGSSGGFVRWPITEILLKKYKLIFLWKSKVVIVKHSISYTARIIHQIINKRIYTNLIHIHTHSCSRKSRFTYYANGRSSSSEVSLVNTKRRARVRNSWLKWQGNAKMDWPVMRVKSDSRRMYSLYQATIEIVD